MSTLRQLSNRVGHHPWVAERPIIKQFIKFAAVGVVNTAVDFLIFTVFLQYFHWHYLVANVAALVGGGTNSYILNRRWTFRSTDPRWHRQLIKFLLVLGVGFSLNEFLLFLLVEHVHFTPISAKALAIIVVLFFNFAANRFWTFRQPKI